MSADLALGGQEFGFTQEHADLCAVAAMECEDIGDISEAKRFQSLADLIEDLLLKVPVPACTALVIWNPPGVLPLVHAQVARARAAWTEWLLLQSTAAIRLMERLPTPPPGMRGRYAVFPVNP